MTGIVHRLGGVQLGPALWLLLAAGASPAQALPIDRLVTVQPIQVRADDGGAGAPAGLFEAETDKIWRQAGIDMEFLPFVTLDETDFLVLEDTSEIVGLFVEAGHGQHPDPLVLNMWFVGEILPPTTTFGIAFVGGNGVAIGGAVYSFNGGLGRRDTLAHEIGHNLGLEHSGSGDPLNLMEVGRQRAIPGSTEDIAPDGRQTDQLTEVQVKVARSSVFAEPVAVPAPASLALLALACLAGMAARARMGLGGTGSRRAIARRARSRRCSPRPERPAARGVAKGSYRALPLPVAQDLAGRVVARGLHHDAPGARGVAAEIETLHQGAVLRLAGQPAQEEQLAQRAIAPWKMLPPVRPKRSSMSLGSRTCRAITERRIGA